MLQIKTHGKKLECFTVYIQYIDATQLLQTQKGLQCLLGRGLNAAVPLKPHFILNHTMVLIYKPHISQRAVSKENRDGDHFQPLGMSILYAHLCSGSLVGTQ
jgi:hypothetical protein